MRLDGLTRLPEEYEIRGIWNNTEKIMLGIAISDKTFDRVIEILDIIDPNMTLHYNDLKDWALIYDII